MSDLRTDDPGRRNSYVYHGPTSVPFPWRARLSTQLYALLLAMILWGMGATLLPRVLFLWADPVPAPVAKAVIVFVLGMTVAVVVARVVGPQITKATPFSYWVDVVAAERAAPRPVGHVTVPEVRVDLDKVMPVPDPSRDLLVITTPVMHHRKENAR